MTPEHPLEHCGCATLGGDIIVLASASVIRNLPEAGDLRADTQDRSRSPSRNRSSGGPAWRGWPCRTRDSGDEPHAASRAGGRVAGNVVAAVCAALAR